MPLKAVLFDMDGVIVDTEPLHRKAYFKMFDDLAIEVSEDLYTSFTGASTKKVCTTIIENFQLQRNHEDLSAIKRVYFKDYFYNDADFNLIPGVKKLIENYYENGVKVVLASSALMGTKRGWRSAPEGAALSLAAPVGSAHTEFCAAALRCVYGPRPRQC